MLIVGLFPHRLRGSGSATTPSCQVLLHQRRSRLVRVSEASAVPGVAFVAVGMVFRPAHHVGGQGRVQYKARVRGDKTIC